MISNLAGRLQRFVVAITTLQVFFATLLVFSPPALAAPPANDDFASSINLPGLSGSISGTTIDATGEPGEPTPLSSIGVVNSVWYSWTPTANVTATFETCSFANYDTWLGAYSGAAVNTLTTLDANDDSCGFLQSRVTFLAVSGTTYHIQVDGYTTS